MSLHMQILAASIGFIMGFVGWPTVFRLRRLLFRLLTADWNQQLTFSSAMVHALSQMFLLLIMLALLGSKIVFFLRGDTSWEEVVAIVVGSSLFGLFIYRLLPKLEALARGTAGLRDLARKNRRSKS